MFDPLQQTIRAYDLSAREHDRKWFHSDVVRSFVTHLAKSLPPRASVLDVGCGSGRDSLQLLEHGLDVVGIDLSEEMVKLARFKSEALVARQMDARRITFPDSIFDGILSVAMLHHVFDDDLATALHEFHRVLKPSGLAHLTFKLGEGVASDTHGRVTQFRSEVESKNALREASFDVIGCVQCVDTQGRPWLQIQAKARKPALEKAHFACPFCVPYLNIENRADGLPCAGSILWGDSDLFVVIDRSPLIEGHLLICTKRHVNSSLEFDGGEAKLNACKTRVRDMLNRIYGEDVVFLEHGSAACPTRPNPCVTHAHIHALPIPDALRHKLECSISGLRRFESFSALRAQSAGCEYMLFEAGDRGIQARTEDVAALESQYFRHVLADHLGMDDYLWASLKNSHATIAKFRSTVDACIDDLDGQMRENPIVSKLAEPSRRHLIAVARTEEQPPGLWHPRLKAILQEIERRHGRGRGLTLSELGEDAITEEILYPAFKEPHSESPLGDDCAVLRSPGSGLELVLTVDPGPTPIIHSLGETDFAYFGWLSMVISISDIAAMGAQPLAALVSTEMPNSMPVFDYLRYLDGMLAVTERYACPIVGGNIREADRFTSTATVIGSVARGAAWARRGAKPGDAVFVIGTMGLFWAALARRLREAHVSDDHEIVLERALRFPEPNLLAAMKLARHGVVTACMDASDGPMKSFEEIAKASGVDIVIHLDRLRACPAVAAVARSLGVIERRLMLTWGNFELIFTAKPQALYNALREDPLLQHVNQIGEIHEGSGSVEYRYDNAIEVVPDLSSRRFSKHSGQEAYLNELCGASRAAGS